MAFNVDGFHEGERRSTYSAANFASVGPGIGKGKGTTAALLAREEGERGGPRAVRLDAEHEALQGGIVDRVYSRSWLGHERERIGQAGAQPWPFSPPSSMSARPREPRFAASNTDPSARCA